MDMLCLMFESDRRGFLQALNGKPYSHEQIAHMTGCSTDEVSRLLLELQTSGVYSRTRNGTIFSRRLLREENERADNRQRLTMWRKLQKTNNKCNKDEMVDETQMKSLSSSSSSSSKTSTTPRPPPSAFVLLDSIPEDLWKDFEEMRKKIRAPLTDRARRNIVTELQTLEKEQGCSPIDVLNQSITHCWRGVFALRNANASGAKNPDPLAQMKFVNGDA